MSASEVRIVAFGRPERDDAASAVLSAAAEQGARTRLVTSAPGEDFATMDHGAIDWRSTLDSAHWLVSSASTALDGASPRYAWGAGMTFGELEGARTVMIVDMPSNPLRLAESWGAVIERIRQVHVLFIAPDAIDALSALEEVSAAELLQRVRHRGLVPHVCTYLPNERTALVEHSLGSVNLQLTAVTQPLEWLAGFLCGLPSAGPGQAGVERAAGGS